MLFKNDLPNLVAWHLQGSSLEDLGVTPSGQQPKSGSAQAGHPSRFGPWAGVLPSETETNELICLFFKLVNIILSE
jgi:hypothetical protein